MTAKFTESDTESYYDAEDEIYRSVWDEEGSVHWGLFDQNTGNDFLKACANLNREMVEKSRINQESSVLDMGCGNGTTAIWLAENQGCKVTGIDLSGVRAENAKKAKEAQPPELSARLNFEKASATDLPFRDGAFTHVWSQAVIYHVHDKEAALKEAYRVLAEGGIMVFDDLIKPQPNISSDAQKYVYERLLYDTDFSFQSYQEALIRQGFKILDAQDLSAQLKASYLCLADRVPKGEGENAEHYAALAKAYIRTANAVDNNELGWGMFVCQK